MDSEIENGERAMTKQEILSSAMQEERSLESSREEAVREDRRDIRRLLVVMAVFLGVAAVVFAVVLLGGKGAR